MTWLRFGHIGGGTKTVTCQENVNVTMLCDKTELNMKKRSVRWFDDC